jgi:hypothetical protein
MKNLESCLIIEKGKIFRRSEKGKTFELSCKKEVVCHLYPIEGCVFLNADFKRCDWLFVIPKNRETNTEIEIDKPQAYYIELKGDRDHSTACEQLFNSIDKTKTAFPNFEFHARIISTTGYQPGLANNEFFKKVKRLISKDIMVCKVHKRNQLKYSENITK